TGGSRQGIRGTSTVRIPLYGVSPRARSSAGQSSGLIIRWSLVRVQAGPPDETSAGARFAGAPAYSSANEAGEGATEGATSALPRLVRHRRRPTRGYRAGDGRTDRHERLYAVSTVGLRIELSLLEWSRRYLTLDPAAIGSTEKKHKKERGRCPSIDSPHALPLSGRS